ncbi:MAG: peptidase dimerization domain-containing protein [Acidaminococcaceae bacterium]|nr:peptidase dimerization domain-containing protein [Acidaminococcaceae bacterium]
MLCGDEEMSHPLTDAVEQFKKAGAGKDAVFNLEFGRVDGSVVTGRKGTTRPTLVVEGIAAHSGNEPEKGASAILELARKTVAIHALNNFELGTTYNVGVFNGGTMANIIADKAIGEVDVRFKTIAEAEKSIADVQRIVETKEALIKCVCGIWRNFSAESALQKFEIHTVFLHFCAFFRHKISRHSLLPI